MSVKSCFLRTGAVLLLALAAGPISAIERTTAGADALALPDLLRETHADPYWLNGEQVFDRAATDLEVSVREGADAEQIATQMLRLIASIGDGHTVLASEDRYRVFGLAPFFAQAFDDGLFLVRVEAERENLLGARIVAVDGIAIDDVVTRLRTVVPHATDSRFRRWMRSYLHLPGLLHALGITEAPNQVRLSLLKEGEIIEANFARMDLDGYRDLDMRDLEFPETLRDRNPDARYWFEALPDSDITYFNFRRVANDPNGESIWAFGQRLAETLKARSTTRLIIDLRENGGGGYQFAAHLRPLLRDVPGIQRDGGIVVLTSPVTYSAASNFLSQVQRHTHATLIGSPPASRLGEPGDDDDFALPATGLTVRISRAINRSAAAADRRSRVDVAIPVTDTFADRIAGIDRALAVALAYVPDTKPPIEPHPGFSGRFRFQADADLIISRTGNQWRARVMPQFDTPLAAIGKTRLQAAMPGLTFSYDEERDAVRVVFADGAQRLCRRKIDSVAGPWELAYLGRFDDAKTAFRAALRTDPSSLTVTDSTFSSEAIHMVYTLQNDIGAAAARLRARRLLEMAIEILDDAPESTFSLRFYPTPE